MTVKPDGDPVEGDPSDEEAWRGILTGTRDDLDRTRRFWRHVPSDPRCKLCWSPFGGLGGILSRITQHGPMARNPLLCRQCVGSLAKHPGGAEIELSVLFADVRDSTRVAETLSPTRYRDLLQRFYRVASEAITSHDGIVDKFLGDGVMALFIPAFTGEGHAGRAVDAARVLRERTDALPEPRLPVGIGIHTGTAFVGALGTEDELDFSALGDAVNVAARLGSEAGAHRILVSEAAARGAGLPSAMAVTSVQLKGRSEALGVIEI